jgi:shikimate kinase
MNVVLIGYRGSGKSTVARLLSAALNMPCACLDEEIIRRAGKTIPEIVHSRGWGYFRDLESEVVASCAARDGWVLDAGGGVVLRAKNVKLLRQNGFLVWLKAPSSILADRIKDDSQRPALTEGKTFLQEVEEVLREREPLYRSAAHLEIDTTSMPPTEVSSRIADRISAQASGSPHSR